ncbi:MAG TPA: STAS domain-containing protein [Candidatus Limiplasma pullicola]|nr:STAS domain-containing protein [Candidatus Limiplasma pullicola]
MEIMKESHDTDLTLKLRGRLDTSTAPELEGELKNCLEGVQSLTLDLKELEYISSAGLRVLLSAQKTMNKQGSMVVRNVNPIVRDVFDITGFSDFLTIE